jgi:hypothetical protein
MRRRQQRQGGFVVGLIAGVAAGVAGGLWLLRPQDDEIEIIADDGPVAAPRLASPPAVAPLRPPAPATSRGPSFMERLQQRWDLAMREGRKAAADRRTELERKLSGDRKEVAIDLVAVSRIDEVSETMAEIAGPGAPAT